MEYAWPYMDVDENAVPSSNNGQDQLMELRRIQELNQSNVNHLSWYSRRNPHDTMREDVSGPFQGPDVDCPSSSPAKDTIYVADARKDYTGMVGDPTATDFGPKMITLSPLSGPESREALTSKRLESLDEASPQTVSSMNNTDGSYTSKTLDGVASHSSSNSSHSSGVLTERLPKLEPEGVGKLKIALQFEPKLPTSQPLHSVSAIAAGSAEPVPAITEPVNKRRRLSKDYRLQVVDFKARTAIPHDISPHELARQSIEAALASRLNPFALHPNEYQLLRDHICRLHVSAYLNVRNRILRLWVRNPLVAVTAEEAAGCSLSAKWLGLAQIAYEWLVRNGYINFGCVEVPGFPYGNRKKCKAPRETIVVIGAGMSGLGCARQLEGLFSHYSDHWTTSGQEPPQVIVLEGRARIGGRIYSHPLTNQSSKRIPKNLRCTAELGAHIITGFDHGNPLNMIIRGQLALHYYPLKDNSSLYDVDGRVVNLEHDRLVEKLFNYILERASAYRHKHQALRTVEGDRSLIELGKDPHGETGTSISVAECQTQAATTQPQRTEDKGLQQVPAGVDKLTGKALSVTGSRSTIPATEAAQVMGWQLVSTDFTGNDLTLDALVDSLEQPSLGEVMDEAIKQYQQFLNLSPQDLRLLNWHFANLEYANAANVGKLSLGGWDQDIGNEFEGEHTQVIGGYIQVPRGILQSPHPLQLRTKHAVTKIEYDPTENHEGHAKVTCSNGEVFDASHVILTTPLGVLKEQSIAFEPKLPDWKTQSIERLGFGILNKVVLVYDRPFWDVDQDMIGLLRDTDNPNSEKQEDYSKNRGRFYLFWNCIKTSGRPLLIALMAGDAAVQAESMTDGELVAEVQHQLCKMFRHKPVPRPLETIVTRWGQDPFARGTYSYVAPGAHSDDYDAMAQSVGNLHFAGEATCGTHPATVHGAYISGLRVASEVINSMIGRVPIPAPLIRTSAPRSEPVTHSDISRVPNDQQGQSDVAEKLSTGETLAAKQSRLEAFEADILNAIFSEIGPRPDKPGKMGANPFLLFSKDMWGECKARCDLARRAALGNSEAKASRNEIRAALGQMWREASDEMKRPYLQQTVENKASNQENAASFQDKLAGWDSKAIAIRQKYIDAHPGVLSATEEEDMWQALGVYTGQARKAKKMSGYADEGPVLDPVQS